MKGDVRRLVQQITQADGVHHINTLSPAKIRLVHAVHELGGPCNHDQLADTVGWTRQYVYRMASELADQGVLIRVPSLPGVGPGRWPARYRCVCMPSDEALQGEG